MCEMSKTKKEERKEKQKRDRNRKVYSFNQEELFRVSLKLKIAYSKIGAMLEKGGNEARGLTFVAV